MILCSFRHVSHLRVPRLPLLGAVIALACAGGTVATAPSPAPRVPLPPPPLVSGPIQLRIEYPPVQDAVHYLSDTRVLVADSAYRLSRADSVFVFGSVGRGDALVFVNGQPIPVYPTGGWIAWVPLRARLADTVATFDLVVWAEGVTERAQLVVPLVPAFDPLDAAVWIDTTSVHPRGDRWLRPNEGIRLSVRAAPGSVVRARVGDSTLVEFLPDSAPGRLHWGERAFGTEAPPSPAAQLDRYVAWVVGAFGPDPGFIFDPSPILPPADSSWVVLEAIRDADTVRARWPLRVGTIDVSRLPVVVVNDDPAATGTTDSTLAGRPSPYGTYHWFFPTGTVAAVSGRWNDQVRLQLSRTSVAWVDARDVHPLPAGTPPPNGSARSMRLVPGEKSAVLRIPLPARVPFRIDETEHALGLRLYGVVADMDWIQYSSADSWVRLITFTQRTEDEAVIEVTLTEPVWGYRTRWEGSDLLLEVRRPPRLDRRRPLTNRLVVLDPGHPPGGATGPTGVREADVVLAVARKAKQLLETRGATVVLTRVSDSAVSLPERIRLAERIDADLMVSIHANALPDGMNPFVNAGTSVYYNHPRSAPLARHLDRALVREFGFRDLGVGRGDLALARPTWMPAVLTEGLFMMLPDQEAVLSSDEGQWRYARGLTQGIVAFLGDRARQGELTEDR